MNTEHHNWENFYNTYPDAHVLQSPAWGQLKSSFGWRAETVITDEIGSQVLFRKLPLGFSIAYIPKGPIGNFAYLPNHIKELDTLCRKNGAIFLKIEPDIYEDEETGDQSALSSLPSFGVPGNNIQPRRTILVSLDGTHEDWLARMKQKTRYNIRLAQKKDIEISQSSDLAVFQHLMEIMSDRNEFGVHSFEYYQKAFYLFHPNNARIFLASYKNQPLAAIMVFFRGKTAAYFYGASSNAERNRMPTYLLQFEAMAWAAEQGCTEYDLWGIPDEDEEALESAFQNRSDGLWGVYRFKRGFGGEIKRTVPAIDRVYKPVLYQIYRKVLGRRNDSN